MSRVWPAVAVGMAGLMVVALGVWAAIPAYGVYVWWALGPKVADAKQAADHYLARLEAKDDAGAYAALCADRHRDITMDRFTDLVEAAPRPVAHRVTGGSFRDESGQHVDVDADLTDGRSAHRSIELLLTYDRRGWSVCGTELV